MTSDPGSASSGARAGCRSSEVAEATGISPSFLSIVENGQSDITVSRLMRLVHWYGVSIADLLQAPDRSLVRVVRVEERRSIELSDERIQILMLTRDGQHAMMPVINVYGEGGGMSESTQHDGEEFVFVLSGTIQLDIGNEDPIVLGPGDSAYVPCGGAALLSERRRRRSPFPRRHHPTQPVNRRTL